MRFTIFAMPASSVILLFSVAFGASNALPWAEPQKTNAYQPDAWSPKPTGSPADPAKLFKRTSVDVNVCGWIGGNSAQAAVCSSGSSCIHDTIHGYVGCCTTSGACTAGVYTSCVDRNSEEWSPNPGMADNGIYTCTGTSVCYRNTYPGGYYQYGCGASSQATSVATTYAGQPSDMYLQIVYTGVNFTPTSAPPTSTTSSSSSSTSTSSSPKSSSSISSSKSLSTTPSHTVPVTGQVSPTSTAQSAGPATPTTTSSSRKNVAAITGGTVGGIAGLAVLIALALFLFRRRQKRNLYHAGPFISSQNHPPTSGPFQRITPFSPDDFNTPPHSGGHTTTSITAGPINFPITYAYAGASDPHHAYSNEAPTPYFPPPARSSQDSQEHREQDRTREETPLVSEIDDFSRNFHKAMQQRMREEKRDTHTHSGVLPGGIGGTGIGMGIGAPLLGNHRTEDREARSEAFRSQLAERSAGWNSPLRSNPTYGSRSVGSDRDADVDVEIPPKSPLRQSMRVAGLNSAVGKRSPDDDVRRYQLVDEVVGNDIPILHSPGQLRHSRQKRSG